jgi:hypothetical protein
MANNNEPRTICANCRHLHAKQDGPRTGIWYNMLCRAPAVQTEPSRDPVSGKIGYRRKNDLGGGCYDDQPSPFCRDVNHGNCEHYARKGVLARLGCG